MRTTWNRGGVWSMDVPAPVLLGATAAAVPLLLLWLFWPRRASAWESCGKALILGGAFGNLWDRVWHDAVRDFIDVCFGDAEGWHYPTFNVADVALVAGIALLFLASFRGRRTEAA